MSSKFYDQFQEKIAGHVTAVLPLYIFSGGKRIVPESSGLNWGMAQLAGSHVGINDAYIPITTKFIGTYPELFPAKLPEPTRFDNVKRPDHRHNDNITMVWDDGTHMTGLLEGTVPFEIDGIRRLYPKQIASSPSKATLGRYLRKRLNVPEGVAITYNDLQTYGRNDISITLVDSLTYYFDFSVHEEPIQKKEEKKPETSIPISVGDVVYSKFLKEGTVTKIEDGLLYVTFATKDSVFQIPNAFLQGFLSLKK